MVKRRKKIGAVLVAMLLTLCGTGLIPAAVHADTYTLDGNVQVDLANCTMTVTIDRDQVPVQDGTNVTVNAGLGITNTEVGVDVIENFADGKTFSLDQFDDDSIDTIKVTVAAEGVYEEASATTTLPAAGVAHDWMIDIDPYPAGNPDVQKPTAFAPGKAMHECMNCGKKKVLDVEPLGVYEEAPNVRINFDDPANPEFTLYQIPMDFVGDIVVHTELGDETVHCDGMHFEYSFTKSGTLSNPTTITTERAATPDEGIILLPLSKTIGTRGTFEATLPDGDEKAEIAIDDDTLFRAIYDQFYSKYDMVQDGVNVAVDLDEDGNEDLLMQFVENPNGGGKLVLERYTQRARGDFEITFEGTDEFRDRFGAYFEGINVHLPGVAPVTPRPGTNQGQGTQGAAQGQGAAAAQTASADAATTTGVATGDESSMLLYGLMIVMASTVAIGIKVKKEFF